MSIHITSFYIFDSMSPSTVEERSRHLQVLGQEQDLRGLILLGVEGFNLTVSGTHLSIEKFKSQFSEAWGYANILFKDSLAKKHPFKLFKVQLRQEIVTLGSSEIVVPPGKNCHLTPKEWQQALDTKSATLIDTRNWYETQVGKFKNAIDLGLNEFRDFPKALEESNLPKDKEYLIYCTGGIRCEKALEEMKRQGFDKVHQLEGGILNYIEQFPNQGFDGECFVFDHRVAVDQQLQPSEQYRLCPHCGQPGDQKLSCLRCDHPATICIRCSESEFHRTCSKNCAYHFRRQPGKKGPHQEESVYFP